LGPSQVEIQLFLRVLSNDIISENLEDILSQKIFPDTTIRKKIRKKEMYLSLHRVGFKKN
jgi:hypothetical protein